MTENTVNQDDQAAWSRTLLANERARINALDSEIARLIAERFEAVNQIAALKQKAALPVLNASREQEVLDGVRQVIVNPALVPHVHRIFENIMAESRAYQEAKRAPQGQTKVSVD